jgi:hypothetical protein
VVHSQLNRLGVTSLVGNRAFKPSKKHFQIFPRSSLLGHFVLKRFGDQIGEKCHGNSDPEARIHKLINLVPENLKATEFACAHDPIYCGPIGVSETRRVHDL